MRDDYGCRIVAHELDAIYMESGDNRVTGAVEYGATLEPFSIDIRLQGRESTIAYWSCTVTAIHCPGHSPGSVVYTTDIDGELILFGQDIHGPIHSELLSDEKQYLASLETLVEFRGRYSSRRTFRHHRNKRRGARIYQLLEIIAGNSLYGFLYISPSETPGRGGY